MRILIINTSEKMGGPAVAASRLMESLKNNGIKAKMLVRDKQTDQISVVGLNRSWLQVWKFMWERLVIWSANRFHRNHMFDVDIANTGTDIMGYITISEIGVELPIYHGTSDSVLQIAAGHLEGTSLPVGGASTHAVISAHRGLPSAKLFTNLDQLEVGDTFTITVLDRVLTYEVDKISIVLPTETDELKIAEGKDYVTLMTCTPYGINTHRLLVRGRRVETPDQYKHLRVTAEALKIEPIIVAPIMALPMLLILLIGMLLSTRKPKKTRGEEHEKH